MNELKMNVDRNWSLDDEEETSMLDVKQNNNNGEIVNGNEKCVPHHNHHHHSHYPNENSSAKGIFAQCLLTGSAMLVSAACGIPIGYSAILLPQLEATNSTMHIDEEMGSWIASIHSAATPFGSLLSGIIMDKLGRRTALQISVIPLIIGWILIATAGNHALLLIGRLVAGMSIGLSAAPMTIIIGETSQPSVRGILGSAPFVSYAFGILLVYAMGSVANWRLVAGLSIILPVISIIVLFFLPESPVWLIRQGYNGKALKSLIWLRGGDFIQAKREMEQLVSRIENENAQASQKGNANLWKTLLRPQAFKPIFIINIFNLLQVVTGTYIVVFYAVDILEQIGDNVVDNFLAAVLTSAVRFLFTIIAGALLIVIGRRSLALISSIGTALASIALGTLLYMNTTNDDATGYALAALVLLYVATNTIGIMILPAIMLGEIYPAKIRGLAGGLTFMIFNIALFSYTKMFPLIKHTLNLYGVFWLFGGCSLFAYVFLYLTLPETKGRTLSQIEDYFMEKNFLWITRDKEWERKNLKENQTL